MKDNTSRRIIRLRKIYVYESSHPHKDLFLRGHTVET